VSRPYQPGEYWSNRLRDGFDLRATGQIEYTEGYNVWLYRAKRRALDASLRDVPAETPALDIGSGVGWVVQQLLRHGMHVDGCDIAEVSVEELGRRFPEATFFKLAMGAEKIPRPDGTYGLVTALDVTYHITDDEQWLAALGEIARVLQPGGRLVVSDGLGDDTSEPASHVRFRSRDIWSQAEQFGFEFREVRPYFRWLSRPRNIRGFRRLGDRKRGALEFALEFAVPRKPHMRCATLVKR
jgi:SAM-dependent methyltransferase